MNEFDEDTVMGEGQDDGMMMPPEPLNDLERFQSNPPQAKQRKIFFFSLNNNNNDDTRSHC